jgi:hypothetical protein
MPRQLIHPNPGGPKPRRCLLRARQSYLLLPIGNAADAEIFRRN